jgi:eukaryotic-like serine/threonine-protein kinase
MELPIRIPGVETEGELGRGAFSVVFRARLAGRPCAVKVPRAAGRSHAWFRREALAPARVKDPGLPAVMEVGEVDGTPYLVMELAEGETLAQRLRRGPFSEPEALGIAEQLCRTLAAVHRRGLVHRDIKPGNLVFDAGSGAVRLVDFGFAVQVDRPAPMDAAGTRAYAAPEQLAPSHALDARADLYAVGAVLCECLTGERLPVDVSPDSMRARLRASGVREPLERILAGLAAADPGQRYASAAAVLRDLRRVQGGLPPLGPEVEEGPDGEGSPPLFGRAAEVARLRHSWDRAREGHGEVALVQGPPGSGKTRLLDTFLVGLGDVRHLRVRCDEANPAPLAALGHMFDGYLAWLRGQPDPERTAALWALRRAAGAQLGPLVSLVSAELAAVLGDTGTAEPPRDIHDAFVEGVAEFLFRFVAEVGPTLLVVDDLHWVDPVSREVLVRVAHRAVEAPLLVVLTARDGETSVPAVRRFVDSLGTDRLTTLALRPLEREALGKLLAAYLGVDAVDPVLAERVAALTDGTPLAALEVLEALVDAGVLAPHWGEWRFDPEAAEKMRLPRSALEILQRRLAALPAASRQVLEVAAVVGTTFGDALVGRVVGIGHGDVAFATAEPRGAGLVEPLTRHRHRFVHERVREALLAGLSRDQVQRLHARVAAAMDAGGDVTEDRVHELATHYALGGSDVDPQRALEVTRRAAERAFERYDNETALRFFGHAADLARRAGAPLDPEHHRRVGEAHLRVGALCESLAAFEAALGGVAGTNDRAEVLGRIAWVHQMRDEPGEAWRFLEQAFTALGADVPGGSAPSMLRTAVTWARARAGPTREPVADRAEHRRLQILCDLHYQNARLAIEYGNTRRFLQSTFAVVDLASRMGPSAALAKAYAMYGFAMTAMGRTAAGLEYLERGGRMAERVADPVVFAYCLQLQSVAHYWLGRMREADALVRRCLDEYGHWLEASELCGNVFNGRTVDALRGRPHQELAWCDRAIARVRRSGQAPGAFEVVEAGASAAFACLGMDEQAAALHRSLSFVTRREGNRGFTGLMLWSVRVRAFTERGDFGGQFEDLVTAFEGEEHDPKRAHIVLAEYYVHVAHARAHQCLGAAPGDRAGRLGDLRRALRDLRAMSRVPIVEAHRHAVEGYWWHFRGEPARARRHLDRAEQLAEQENAPWVLYAVARAEAHILRAAGHEEAAREKARIAAMLAREHGAVHRLRFIAEEFDLRVSTPPPSRSTRSELTSSGRSDRRRRQLRTLLQIVRTSSRELDLQEQAREVLDELVQTMEADRGLLVYEADTGEPVRVVAGAATGEPDPQATELLGRVRASGEAFLGPDSATVWDVGTAAHTAPLLAVPLVLKERIVGVVCLERTAHANPFDEEDRDLLVALSYQVLSALELTRLLQQRERLEQGLRQAQKMEAVGRLAGGIAHDFNNMLTVIEASLEAMKDRSASEEEPGADLEMIQDATHRAKALTRQLLAFSRRQVLRAEVHDVNALLSDLAPMLRRLIGDDVRVDLDLCPRPHPVRIDRSSLEQAVVNLVVNARDAMPKGGTLTLRTTNVDLDARWAQERGIDRQGPHLQLTVADTGEGMAPEVRARIFEPFFTTKQLSGTGLGLSTVYGFVTQSQGHVEVDSEVGQGTAFHLYLPRSEGVPARPSTIPPRPEAVKGSGTILLVEDERLVRNSVRRLLKRMGFEVLAAEGAAEALALAHEHGDRISLVITDVLMPEVSGPELAAQLRQHLPHMRLMYMSGYTDGHLAAHGVLEDGVALLQKPFTSAELRERIGELLGGA